MIIVMKPMATKAQVEDVIDSLESQGMQIQINTGVECTVLGIIGDTLKIDREAYSLRPGVDRIMKVSEPYKRAGRKFHPDDTVVTAGGVEIGGNKIAVIAGPCSVESKEQIFEVARSVKTSGAHMLRGGAFKPRTSPYSFQGLEELGLELLAEARRETGLPIVSEIMSTRYIDEFVRVVDIIQVGARNMQNFDLLKELGRTNKPILLKRGLSSTIEELLMSSEYILSQGNKNVILCERGIRTFETMTRNTLDISAIGVIKRHSHLPVVVDPSHASGLAWLVESLSLAAVAAGADGLLVEVHNCPEKALCDGPQSLRPVEFDSLMKKLSGIATLMGRSL